MDTKVICDICGKRTAVKVCRMCGRRVCGRDSDVAGYCKSCMRGRKL